MMAIEGITFQGSSAVSAYTAQAENADSRQNPTGAQPSQTFSVVSKISNASQVRASLEDVQSKAKALKDFSKPPTLQDFKLAIQGMVGSLNNLRKSVEASKTDNYGLQIQKGIDLAVDGKDSGAQSDLRKAGIDRKDDGTLALNQAQLDKSFNEDRPGTLSAVSSIATRIDAVAGKQPAPIGVSDKKSSDLSTKQPDRTEERRADERTRTKLDTQKNSQQLLASHLATAGGFVARNAVVTYFTVSSY